MMPPEITNTNEATVHAALDEATQKIALLPISDLSKIASLINACSHLVVRAVYDAHGHTSPEPEADPTDLEAQEDGPNVRGATNGGGLFIPGQRVA